MNSVVVVAFAGYVAALMARTARQASQARVCALGAHSTRPARRLRWKVHAPHAGRELARRLRAFRSHNHGPRDLPVAIELLRMAQSAGLTPTEAIRTVAPMAPGQSGAALSEAARAIGLGLGLEAAVVRMSDGFPALRPTGEALLASRQLGAAVDDTLARLGAEARAELRRAAEARARTVPVRLLFPLVTCVLPAFALLGIAPSLIAGLAG